MISRHKTKLTLLAVLLTATIGIAPALAQTTFNWNGEGADNNRTTCANWGQFIPDYPGNGGATDDIVIINDSYPRPLMVQDTAPLTIASLFIGDGHAIQLDYDITVTTGAYVTGSLQIEGLPDGGETGLTVIRDETPAREIQAQWVLVNSDQKTIITTDVHSSIRTN